MERKTGFELKSLDEKGLFVARIARLAKIDLDNDVTERGAFGNGQVVPVLYGHAWNQIPLGKVRLTEEGDEVLARGKLNLEVSSGRELYESLKFDLANPPSKAQFSYGFSIEDSGHGLFEGRPVRFLKKLKVHEVSAVLAGAGDTALLAVKGDLVEQTAAVVASVQETLRRGAAWLAKLDSQVSYRYIEMLDWNLLDPRRHLARDVSFHAAKELGVSPPEIRFFTSTDPERAEFVSEKMWGYSRKGDHIAIEWTLSPAEMTQVVAHEVAHAAGLDEEKADAFGKSFAARYGRQFNAAPRPGSGWTGEQLVAAAMWVRLQGVRM